MTRPLCVVLDDYQQAATRFADWSRLAIERVIYDRHFETEAELLAAIGDASIVVAMRERTPFSRPLLEKLPRLKLLCTTARRNPSIDLRAAEALGITVCGTDALQHPTPELTWGLILALLRDIPREDANLRAGGRWQLSVGVDLHGKTLGLLGLGMAGARVARVGLAFGMRVIGWSNNLTAARCAELGVEQVSKDRLLAESDILSIHTQLSRRTVGLIGRAELATMKPTAYLVNTSRGFIVEEEALIEALESGQLAGAALDVYEREPLPLDHPLRRTRNTVLTPHLGYVSEDNYRIFFAQTVENIAAWLGGSVTRRMDPEINIDRSR